MKTIVGILCSTFIAVSAFAQHTLEGDGGTANYFIISGTGLAPGISTYTLPPGGGTFITTTSNLGWLTAGNSLTGGTPTTPAQFFGSNNNFDIILKTNGTEQLRLLASGGMKIPVTTAAGVGAIFQNGLPFIHSFGVQNFFAGENAGNFTTTGNSNVGVGYHTFMSTTSGFANTAVGAGALASNLDGTFNSAFGVGALGLNTSGALNTGAGSGALANNTVGTENTAVGLSPLYSNTTASKNVAVGEHSLFTQSYSNGGAAWDSYNTAVGYEALYNNQPTATNNGIKNTALGWDAGITNTIGTTNTFVGYVADAAANNLSNASAIGSNAYVAASNSLVLGSINGTNSATASTNVGIGTTTPARALHVKSTALTTVRIEGLPTYANDAAAGAAGLATGDLYVSNVGGDLFLKVKQ